MKLFKKPIIALLNCKRDCPGDFKDEWERVLSDLLIANRMLFDGVNANYNQRVELIKRVASIDDEINSALKYSIKVLERNWEERLNSTAALLINFFDELFTGRFSVTVKRKRGVEKGKKDVIKKFVEKITREEKNLIDEVCKIFKHNEFTPSFSEINVDLLKLNTGKETNFWPYPGSSYNVFIDIHPEGQDELVLYLVDRFLTLFNEVINWSHGKRNYLERHQIDCFRFSKSFSEKEEKAYYDLFKSVTDGEAYDREKFSTKIKESLKNISSRQDPGHRQNSPDDIDKEGDEEIQNEEEEKSGLVKWVMWALIAGIAVYALS